MTKPRKKRERKSFPSWLTPNKVEVQMFIVTDFGHVRVKRYRIRSVYSPLLGNGYELQRRRWFGWVYVKSAWLDHNKDALESLRAIVRHLEQL